MSGSHINHVRRVHFSLTVAALALLIAITSIEPPTAERALLELREILNVLARWDAELLEWHGRRTVAEEFGEHRPESMVWQLAPSPRLGSIRVAPISPAWTLQPYPRELGRHVSHGVRILTDPSTHQRRYQLQKPSTLGEFEELWNVLPRMVAYVLDSDLGFALIRRYGEIVSAGELVEIRRVTNGSELASYHLRLEAVTTNEEEMWTALLPEPVHEVSHKLETGTNGVLISIPVTVQRVPINGQVVLMENYGVSWYIGDFDYAFPQLSKMASDMSVLLRIPFEVADLLLVDEANRASEQFELPGGIKVPVSRTATWGVIVLLVVQMYFWLHVGRLVEIMQRAEGRPKVPWIGLYDNWSSKIVTMVSAVLLPFVTTIYTVWVAESEVSLALTGMAVVISGVLALVSGCLLFELWKNTLAQA